MCLSLTVFVCVRGQRCVCVFSSIGSEASHCAQSQASILCQQAGAKAQSDPNLTWLLVWACTFQNSLFIFVHRAC